MSESSPHVIERIDADIERFLVHDRLEILSILEKLRVNRESVMLNIDGDGVTLTLLLAINPEFEEVVLDCGNDPESNRMIMRAERITLVANTDGIKVQFGARGADATVFEGRPALRVRLPDILLRLQRREFYRVPAGLACEAAVTHDGKVRVVEFRVADLSLGGIALVTDKTQLGIESGTHLQNCVVGLGSLGRLALDLIVRHADLGNTRSGTRQLRIGCEFDAPTRSAQTLISRYVTKMERERRMIA